MKPKFADPQAWQQAELLMQPAYIRLVDQIRRHTEETTAEVSYEEVTEPFPSNLLCLKRGDRTLRVDIWEMCFQVCFTNYEEMQQSREQIAQIDESLFELDTGEVDWQKLDRKAQDAVSQIFLRFKLLAG
jgi:hypothetical protein